MILLFAWENSDYFCLLSRDRWVLDAASKMGCPFSKKPLGVKCRGSSWSRDQNPRLSHKVKIQQFFYFLLQGTLSRVSDSLDQSTPRIPFCPHASAFFCRKPQCWGKEGSRHWGLFPAWRQNTSRSTGMAFHHLGKTPVLRNNISPVWKAI